MGKTLVAELPPMSAQDLAAFEAQGGIWGKQRAVRRQQLQFAGSCSALSAVGSALYSMKMRNNTKYVGFGMFLCYGVIGAVVGNYVGTFVHPSVASNSETTMMRRLWWAKQCMKVEEVQTSS